MLTTPSPPSSSPWRNTEAAMRLLARPRTKLGTKVSLLFVVLSTPFIRDHEQQRHLEHIHELLSTVQSTVQITSFAADQELATEVARGLLANQSIAGVRITANTLVLVDLKKSSPGNAAAQQVSQTVYSPFDAQMQVGKIILSINEDFIRNQAAQYSRFLAMLLLLEVLAATAVVERVMLRTVVRPITIFAAELRRIEGHSGQHLATPKAHEANEIGYLARTFNRMIDRLAGKRAPHARRSGPQRHTLSCPG